jgi:hypothetical protein
MVALVSMDGMRDGDDGVISALRFSVSPNFKSLDDYPSTLVPLAQLFMSLCKATLRKTKESILALLRLRSQTEKVKAAGSTAPSFSVRIDLSAIRDVIFVALLRSATNITLNLCFGGDGRG